MTLIVTLEHADLNDVVTFSDYAASQPDVQLNGASGQNSFSGLKDLCFSLMLESHNDSAVAMADLARIMSYCINESPMKETFLEITQTPSYSFSDNIENTKLQLQ